MILMDNRSFFHSFRRVRPDEDTTAALVQSLAILEVVKNVGLVLAPEVVAWEIPLVDGTTKHIKYRQTRICFTELSARELPGHCEKFGPISLEFDQNTLRNIGALPVMYVPQATRSDRNASSIGPTMVWIFDLIRKTIGQIENLRILSNPDLALNNLKISRLDAKTMTEDYTVSLRNTNDQGNIISEHIVDNRVLKGILDYIGYKNAPFELMKGVLYAAQSLFYPTDDQHNDAELAYYRQREWRLIPGIAKGGLETTRRLTSVEQQLLLGLDQRFWTRELSDDAGSFRRIDEARVIDRFQSKPIQDAISTVLVPPAAREQATSIFGERVQTIEIAGR